MRAGDLDAYSEIVSRFQDMAVGYAYSQLGDFHLAEDAAQEAFLQAYLDLEKLREPAAFPGWFRRIVFKQCDRVRRRKQLHAVPLDEGFEIGTDDKNPAEQLDSHDTRLELSLAIRHLPEAERAVTTLFYISQFTQREIAAFLEVPESKVNNRLHSARKRLKKELINMAQGNLQQQRPSKDDAFAGRVKEQIEAVQLLHEKLAPALAKAFANMVGKEVEVEVSSATHTIAVEVVQFMQNPAVIYSFIPQPESKRIFYDLGMELVAALVDRDPTNMGQVSPAEIDKLNVLAKEIFEQVIALWQDAMDIAMLQPEIETNPLCFIANPKHKCIDAEEPIFHVPFIVKWDGGESKVNLCYAADSMAAALEKLRQA